MLRTCFLTDKSSSEGNFVHSAQAFRMDFSRRRFLTSLAALGMASHLPSLAEAATAPAFSVPVLPYGMAALEPYIDSATMTIHHDKHHAAYVKGLNEALARQPGPWSNWTVEQLLQDLESLPAPLQTPVRNHGGGHYNHSLWWKWIGPPGQAVPTDLQEALSEHFGSWANFQQKMVEAGMARFGSGWVWLVLDKQGNFAIRSTANQDSPLLDGLEPLLGIDVWEHAYYLKYQNMRKDYLEAVFKVIQWEEVGVLWRKARS